MDAGEGSSSEVWSADAGQDGSLTGEALVAKSAVHPMWTPFSSLYYVSEEAVGICVCVYVLCVFI
jgi:hypothetical protein